MQKRVMSMAHKIKGRFQTFSESLKAAWIIVKLSLGYYVNLTFAKDTGEIRKAQGIAMGSLSTIEKGFVRFLELLDEDRTQWRSFRIERLIL